MGCSRTNGWWRTSVVCIFFLLIYAFPALGGEAAVFVQIGHVGNVLSVAVSPDGRLALSGGRDATVKLWEMSSGREIRTLVGHFAAVNGVAFSPDGKFVLSGSSDATLRLWDPATGDTVRVFRGSRSSVSAVAVSPDGRQALSAGLDPVVRLWDVETGREMMNMSGHEDSVNAVAFSPDGKTAASAASDGTLRLWDLSAGKEIRAIKGSSSGFTAVVFSPDGQRLLSGDWSGGICLWDAATGEAIARLAAGGSVFTVGFGSDGLIFSGGTDEVLTLWKPADLSTVGRFTGHRGQITSAVFIPDGGYVLSGSWDGTLKLWDIGSGREVRTFAGLGGGVDAEVVAPGGGRAVSGGAVQAPMVWNLVSGRGIMTLPVAPGGVNAMDYSPDGRSVLTADRDGVIEMWDEETGERIRTFKGHEGSVEAVQFTPDGHSVVSGSLDRTIRVWDAADGREIRRFEGFKDSVDVPAVSPDGKYFLAEDSPDFLLLDLATGETVQRYSGHGPGVETVAFSPDGRFILSGSFDRTMKLWETSTGRFIRTFTGHTDSIEAVAFSPDGRLALSGGWDTTLRLWDISTGETIRILKGHTGWVTSAGFTPDGRRIFSGSADGTSRLWDVETGRELARFTALAGGEWIVITPEGYYGSSPNGHSSLNVRLDNRVYGIDQFYDVFYRPDIVEHKLKGNDIGPLIRLTIEEALKNPPPGTQISELPESTDAARITVVYRVKSEGGGIGEVRVFHNGKLVKSDGFYRRTADMAAVPEGLDAVDGRTLYEEQRDLVLEAGTADGYESPPKGQIFEDQVEIEMTPGENVISVCAFNRDNTIQGRMRSVTVFDRRQPEAAHLFICAVGIDDYRDPKARLNFAAKDAGDAAARLAEAAAGAFPSENIHQTVMIDAEAVRENILGRIRELSKRVKAGDLAVLFFAGHGLLLGDQYYFVTQEYDGRLSDDCLISSNDVVEMSKRLRSLSQLFIFDTCHAGGLDYIITGLYDARLSVLAKKLGLHIYASSSSFQTALDGYQGNGLFTHELLAGLSGDPKIDENGDRFVSMVELGDFVRINTQRTAHRLGYPQTPTIIDFGQDIRLYAIDKTGR